MQVLISGCSTVAMCRQISYSQSVRICEYYACGWPKVNHPEIPIWIGLPAADHSSSQNPGEGNIVVDDKHQHDAVTGSKPDADDTLDPVQSLGQPEVPTYVALYSYDARTAEDLSFRKGTAIDSTYTILMQYWDEQHDCEVITVP